MTTATVGAVSSSAADARIQVRGTALTDNTPPTLDTAVVNGDTLTLTYDETLDTASTPDASAFMLGGTPVSVNTVMVSGMTVTLTLSAPVSSEATVTVSYTAPTATGTNPVQDVAGNPAANLMMQAVTNSTPDNTPPMLTGAAVNGNMLTLTYDEPLDAASMPAASTFTLGGGTSETVSTVMIDDMTVTLTLSGAVNSASVTVSYTKPGMNPVQDAAGNEADSFTDEPVADNTPPMLVALGLGVFGDMLVVRYDEALDESSVPAASAFTVSVVGGTSPTVSAVAVSDTDVNLTLSAPVSPTDVVTVSYMKPGTNPVQDEAGNEADSFTDESVINQTSPVPTDVMASSTAPGALAVSWTEPALLFVSRYHVQYRIAGGTDWLPETPEEETAVTEDNTITHTFTGLAAGMYRARVRSSRRISFFGGVDVHSAWEETTGSAVQVDEALALTEPTDLVYTVNVAIDPAVTLPAATGGTGTISYTLTGPSAGALPAGLMFDTTNRQLSGIPTMAGTTELTYTATDSASPTPATVTQTFTITVNTVLTLPTQDNLAYTVGTAIAPVTLPQATNGVGTITYALSGTLPAGLAFNANTRVLSGTPSTAGGPTTLTYMATDSATPTPATATQTFTITVSVGLAFPAQDDLAYTVGTAIDPVTLPAATNGTGAITYALTGALPAGLAFNAGTRVLSGTPTTASGPTTLTYTATDSTTTPTMATQMFTITINAALALTVPNAQSYGAGTAIPSLTLPAATGGTTPISYTLTGPSAGPLPAGLTFNATTRVLSGTRPRSAPRP